MKTNLTVKRRVLRMEFEKQGSYWGYPLWKKIYLNIVYWLNGFFMFIKCLLNYDESIKGNEFSIHQAWDLCFSIQEARMGKTYRMVDRKEGDAKDVDN
jgi:hypothetical protein